MKKRTQLSEVPPEFRRLMEKLIDNPKLRQRYGRIIASLGNGKFVNPTTKEETLRLDAVMLCGRELTMRQVAIIIDAIEEL